MSREEEGGFLLYFYFKENSRDLDWFWWSGRDGSVISERSEGAL